MKKNRLNGPVIGTGLLKMMKIMRYTLFLIALSLSQAFAVSSYSQNARLSLDMKNARLEQVIDKIEENTEFFFMYNRKMVDVDRIVSITVKDKNVSQVLDLMFDGSDVNYSIWDRQILLISNSQLNGELTETLQQGVVTGTVADKSGTPLPGVTVVVKGTTTGTITGNNGSYSLSSVPPNATLVFSFVGMRTQEVAVGNKTSVNITLLEETVGIEEVVAVGYGVQKKANLTGAVGFVSSEVLENRAIQNAGQGLQGTIGNLNVVTNPGDPGKIGQGSSYQIRGQGSINGGAPLVLIDGVQGDLNQINPNDIENISVLKDAASAAIYGARATFGVILVTTKKGSASKISVSLNSSISSNSITNFPKVVNSLVYAEVMNEASRNAGIADYFPAEQIERIKKYIANPKSIPTTVPDPNDPTRWSYALGNDNVNYMKVYYKDNMFSQKHDLAISGGSEKLDYRFSAGYLDQDGVYAFGQDVYKRYNILGNVNATLTEWLTFKFQTMLNIGVTDEPFEYAGNIGNYFHTAWTRQPHWPFYDPNGKPMWTSQKQPFEGARRVTRNDEIKMLGEVIIEPLTGWTINTRVSYNKQLESGTAQEAKLYAWDVNNNPWTMYGNSSYNKSYWVRDYKNLELFSTYTRQLNDHSITGLIGMQAEELLSSSLFGNVRNLITDEIPSLNTGTGVKNTGEGIDEWFNIGYFGRLNYNYKEKYLFEANARYDATSKFPEDRRWGLFPSVSGGWNIAKEEFFNVPKVNLLKLRASYGLLGNQQISNYLFFSRVPILANLGHILGGVRPNYFGAPGLVSNNLTWATAATLDFGLDIQALDNRLSFSFDWYTRTTTDMVGPANAVPSVLGTSVPQTNNADMVTRGFEVSAGWRDRIGNDFNHSIQFNLSDYMSEITKYNNPNKLLSTYYEGQKLGEIWGFETVGIIQSNEQLANMADQKTHIYNGTWYVGDIEYRDLNNDKKISYGSSTFNDPGDRKVIGNNTPRFSFGLIYNANWKGFDFNMFWQGIMKRDIWLGDIPFFGITGSWTQQIYNTTLDYWSTSNTGAYFARPYATNQTTKNQLVQTRFLQNAAYARLKNIQIGYSLPEGVLNSLKMQKIRIYISGENLFYLSGIDENFDPERLHGSWGSGKTYPLFRTLTAGISLTL